MSRPLASGRTSATPLAASPGATFTICVWAPRRTWRRALPSAPSESALTGTTSTAPFVLLTATVSLTDAPTSDADPAWGTTSR